MSKEITPYQARRGLYACGVGAFIAAAAAENLGYGPLIAAPFGVGGGWGIYKLLTVNGGKTFFRNTQKKWEDAGGTGDIRPKSMRD